MKIKIFLCLIYLLILIVGCVEKAKKADNEKVIQDSLTIAKKAEKDYFEGYNAALEATEPNNFKNASNLILKYNATLNWDTLNEYTYTAEKYLIDQGRIIAFYGYVSDIEKVNNAFYLKVQCEKTKLIDSFDYISILKISPAQLDSLNSCITKYRKSIFHGYFFFKVSEISKKDADPNIKIFKGSLIDFVIDCDNKVHKLTGV
ncbi:MAG: hypothetical protein ABI723_11890 [Bacteroidia bacterium]